MNIRPYIRIGLFSLILIPFTVGLNHFSPPKEKVPIGYSSTIVAFEFVKNNVDLEDVFSPLTADEIKGVDMINYIDFGFMICYSILLFIFIRKRIELSGQKFLSYILYLPIAICLFDILENMQLLGISSCYQTNCEDYGNLFIKLQIYTWVKWGSLALYFCFLGLSFLQETILVKIAGIILLLPIVLCILALFTYEIKHIDYFTSSIFLMFLIVTIYSFTFKSQTDNQ